MGCHFIKPKSPRLPMSRGWWSGVALESLAGLQELFFHLLGYNSMEGMSLVLPWPKCIIHRHAHLCPLLLSLLSISKIKSNVVPKRWKIIFKPRLLSSALRRNSRTLRNRLILALWSQWRKPDLLMEASTRRTANHVM